MPDRSVTAICPGSLAEATGVEARIEFARNPNTPKPEPPKPCAPCQDHGVQGFVLRIRHPSPRTQAPTPCAAKARDFSSEGARAGREGLSVAGDRFTLAIAVRDLRTPRLSTLPFAVLRLPVKVARLSARVQGLHADWKPSRTRLRGLQIEAGTIASGIVVSRTGPPALPSVHAARLFGMR
jgi:hypothetical protein